MGNALIPCPSCRRHVRVSEEACRFCGAAVPSDVAAPPALRGRMSRGAALAFASTMAVTGCGASTVDTPADTGVQDTGAAGTLYGAPADTGVRDTGAPGTLYGGVPVDTGVADTGPDDSGSPGNLYGAPADAG